VLLVDRHADTRFMYEEYLGLAGWIADHAEDGQVAWHKTRSIHYDAIVTETRLASIDGYDLCRHLKHDGMTAAIPIVVVTGDALDADVARARHAGADTVLLKPCLPQVLMHELNRQLANPSQRAAAATPPNGTCTVHGALATCSDAPLQLCPRCNGPLVCGNPGTTVIRGRRERWQEHLCPRGCGTFRFSQSLSTR
jgi:DNA-binding response OmpR family regulator